MKQPFGMAMLILAGSSLTTPARAFEMPARKLRRKDQTREGYGVPPDTPCSMAAGPSDLFGGAFTFEVQGIEKLLVDKRRVEADSKPGVAELKWVAQGGPPNPGRSWR